MSGLTGRLIGIPLSMGLDGEEWHQRTAVVKRADGLYDLYPAYPDKGTPTQLQFVRRPYQANNADVGVTPEALLYTLIHYLEQPQADDETLKAIAHIDQALTILHGRKRNLKKD